MPLGVLLAAGAATKGAEALAVLAAGATAYKLRKPKSPGSEADTENKDPEEKNGDREDDTAGLWEFEEEDIQGWLPGAHLRVDGDQDEAPVCGRRRHQPVANEADDVLMREPGERLHLLLPGCLLH